MAHSMSLVTQNQVMRSLLAELDRFTQTDVSVLLIGETGVGKELFAEYVHRTSERMNKTFVKLSLASLAEELLGSELFGHEKGSFTSATSEKKGLFEIANQGTIFLDDIDDVPLDIQTKLLRVLENGEIFRVGGIKPIKVDVRLIAATKVDLKERVKEGRFRSDLYYRIHVYPVTIPPLRERKDDIVILADHFIKLFAGHKNVILHPRTVQYLQNYEWPGNVRELKNVMQRLVFLADSEILPEHLPADIHQPNGHDIQSGQCINCLVEQSMNHEEILSCLEQKLVHYALEQAKGNKTQAAKRLGLSPSTFRDKCHKYGLNGTE